MRKIVEEGEYLLRLEKEEMEKLCCLAATRGKLLDFIDLRDFIEQKNSLFHKRCIRRTSDQFFRPTCYPTMCCELPEWMEVDLASEEELEEAYLTLKRILAPVNPSL